MLAVLGGSLALKSPGRAAPARRTPDRSRRTGHRPSVAGASRAFAGASPGALEGARVRASSACPSVLERELADLCRFPTTPTAVGRVPALAGDRSNAIHTNVAAGG